MNSLAIPLQQQGKLAEAGLRSFVKRGGDLPGGSFSGAYFFVWPRPEAWILSFRFPNIGWIAFLGRNTLLGPPSTFHSCNWQNENMANGKNCQIFWVNSCK